MKTAFNIFCVFILGITTSLCAHAVPSVKKLGVAKPYTAVADKPESVISPARTGSLKVIKTSSVKPVKETKGKNNLSASRLSVGKYLHNAGKDAGIIKPVNKSDNISNTSVIDNKKIEELTARIEYLEQQIENMQPKLSVKDTDESDGKVVRSMVITDDNVVELQKANVKIPVGSEDSDNAATIWIEKLD